jgi:hypothetical protein
MVEISRLALYSGVVVVAATELCGTPGCGLDGHASVGPTELKSKSVTAGSVALVLRVQRFIHGDGATKSVRKQER